MGGVTMTLIKQLQQSADSGDSDKGTSDLMRKAADVLSKNDIWIVTTGEYSSYSVTAAFTEGEVADEFTRISNANTGYGWPEYRVERIDLNPPMPVLKQRPVVTPVEETSPALTPMEATLESKRKLEERDAIIESIDWGGACLSGELK